MKFLAEALRLIVKACGVLIEEGPREFLARIDRKLRIWRRRLDPRSRLSGYALFIYDTTPTRRRVRKMKKEYARFSYQPLVSIVMPVYNVEASWLTEAVASVQRQIYGKWELCICDDASTAPHIPPLLEKYAASDPRIKLVRRRKNGGIAVASNDALNAATGDYIGLCDHDDVLSPDALFEVVKALQANKYVLIYTDEDKIDAEGRRSEPFFKPDWSPDLLLCVNYVAHFSVYRRTLLKEIGGFREGFDGSQDYDLVLRLTEKSGDVGHIPKILYHWRRVPGSMAANAGGKPYAHVSAKRALKAAMERRRIDAEVIDGLWFGSYRVKAIIKERPRISVIIPFKDRKDILEKCLGSIFEKTTYPHFEILLIDNRSVLPETVEYLKTMANDPRIRLFHFDAPFNYSAINNFAAQHAQGEVLILLNNDTEVITPDWMESMLEHSLRRDVGAVGAKLLYPDRAVQHGGVLLGPNGLASHAFHRLPDGSHGYFGLADAIRNTSAVTAACLMMRKDVYESIGGLDDRHLPVAFNDVDLCLRLRQKGYLIVYTPYACLYHHESLSRGFEVDREEIRFMQRKYADLLKNGDPYYNPNLTLERPDCSLRCMDVDRS